MVPRSALARLLFRASGNKLAPELTEQILDELYLANQRLTTTVTASVSQEAATPPSGDNSPFMGLPTELRREIFAASLPRRDAVFPATCGEKGAWVPNTNRITELMLINRKIKDEIAEMLYEERTFAIHVHCGIQVGGIEFLDTGRLPLQYMTDNTDYRFPKFSASNQFGFTRIKKIELTIFPGGSGRHNALNTYYMMLALVRLLDRPGSEKNRITSLKIIVLDGPATLTSRKTFQLPGSSFWWNAATKAPSATSIQSLSHIHLALYPLSLLSNIHMAEVLLPSSLTQHPATVDFATSVEETMKAVQGTGGKFNDNMERQIESMRGAFEDFVLAELYSGGDRTTTTRNEMVTEAEHEIEKSVVQKREEEQEVEKREALKREETEREKKLEAWRNVGLKQESKEQEKGQEKKLKGWKNLAQKQKEKNHKARGNGVLNHQQKEKHELSPSKEVAGTIKRSKVDHVKVGQFLKLAGFKADEEDAIMYLAMAGDVEKAVAMWYRTQED